jgi:hypothetical protein
MPTSRRNAVMETKDHLLVPVSNGPQTDVKKVVELPELRKLG